MEHYKSESTVRMSLSNGGTDMPQSI